jgi:Cu+-exporting ATPase
VRHGCDPGGSADCAGVTYWFCSAGCRERFVADPSRYAAATPRVTGPRPATTDERIYTCPMHPQVRQKSPGSCPICGMALEPLIVVNEEGPDPELLDMTRRFWIGLVLTLPLLAFVMGDMLPGQPLRHVIPGRLSATDRRARRSPHDVRTR